MKEVNEELNGFCKKIEEKEEKNMDF